MTIITVVGGGFYARYRFLYGRETEARAKLLASEALERLSLQAALHAQEPGTYREDYVSVAQLRDDILRDEFSATRRKKVWEKVQQKVEHNSNVRPLVKEGRAGDVGRVWEWVGAVGMIDTPPQGLNRRKSAQRVWLGGKSNDRFVDSNEGSEIPKWKEGRPYY